MEFGLYHADTNPRVSTQLSKWLYIAHYRQGTPNEPDALVQSEHIRFENIRNTLYTDRWIAGEIPERIPGHRAVRSGDWKSLRAVSVEPMSTGTQWTSSICCLWCWLVTCFSCIIGMALTGLPHQLVAFIHNNIAEYTDRIWCEGAGTKPIHETYVAHRPNMTGNNTRDKVHVAATELPQLLSQIENVWRGKRTTPQPDFVQL